MANATGVHGFELDDVHLQGQIHPGAVTLPAVMALAEREGSSGADVLRAVLTGYEIGIRLGIAAGRGHGLSGFHPTGTIGCIAAAAAAASLLRLDAETATHALALGATQASGLYSARTGGMAKRFHAGHAASAGVTAATLAAKGFTGAPTAIEEAFGGFLTAMRCDGDHAAIAVGLGEHWEAAGVGFKIYATCASAQTIVAGVRELVAQGVTPQNLRRLDIFMGRIAVSNVGWRYVPADVVAAQMNGSYAAAVTLIDGDAFIAQFAEDRIHDATIFDLTSRVTFAVDPEIESGGLGLRHASRLVAHLADGRVLEAYNAQRPGGPGKEIPRARIIEKFLRLAGPAIGDRRAERLLDGVQHLQTLEDIRVLLPTLRGERSSQAVESVS
jgi:2-methylcitrate dehydratase PrpD